MIDHLANTKQLNNPTMNTKIPTKLLSLVAAASLAASASFAQDNAVTSDVVGYVTTTITSGYNAIGSTFVKEAAFSGTISSATANTLTLSANPSLDTGSNTYYLEVTSVPSGSTADIVGERIDVASVTDNVVTLNTTASHNTIEDVSAFPANTSVVIRAHFTVGDLNTLLGDNVNSDDQFTASGSDQILFFENGAFRSHIEYQGVWYQNFGSFSVVTNKIIAPGSGFFYYRNPTAGTASEVNISFTGTVRSNDFAQKLNTGYQFVSTGYPIAASPSELQLNDNLEASDGFAVSESDLILTWDKSTQAFRVHLLYNNAGTNEWYQNYGSFSKVDSTDLIDDDSAALILVRNTAQVLEIPRLY